MLCTAVVRFRLYKPICTYVYRLAKITWLFITTVRDSVPFVVKNNIAVNVKSLLKMILWVRFEWCILCFYFFPARLSIRIRSILEHSKASIFGHNSKTVRRASVLRCFVEYVPPKTECRLDDNPSSESKSWWLMLGKINSEFSMIVIRLKVHHFVVHERPSIGSQSFN